MVNVVSIDRHKELVSNQGQAKRYFRLAKELEVDIEKMREMQRRHVYTDMEARHLEGAIQTFTYAMNKHKSDALKLRAM